MPRIKYTRLLKLADKLASSRSVRRVDSADLCMAACIELWPKDTTTWDEEDPWGTSLRVMNFFGLLFDELVALFDGGELDEFLRKVPYRRTSLAVSDRIREFMVVAQTPAYRKHREYMDF